jgi:hypothetical protein
MSEREKWTWADRKMYGLRDAGLNKRICLDITVIILPLHYIRVCVHHLR